MLRFKVKAVAPVYTVARQCFTLTILGLCYSSGGKEHLRLGRVLGFGSTAWLEQVYGYLGGAYREMDEWGADRDQSG